MASSRRAVQHEAIPRELPGDELDDVLFNSHFGVRTVELNRPKKLNSLDGSMCRKIIPRLLEWEKSDMISAVIMKGAGEKALCAGGDVAALATWNQEGPEGRQRSIDYFALEYKLDHLIATYTKPYIAFMDGITMGGGVGLSVHAPFRIATERTTFAMPETTIGFFPEVGGSFFLPRLDGQLGKYLALTSGRLQGVQAYYHGIATHYVHSSSLPDLESRLAELTIPDYASLEDRWKIIDNTIAEYVSSLPRNQPIQLAGERRKAIDRCFAPVEIEEVFDRLEEEAKSSSTEAQWAQKTIDTMQGRSPTSLKVTLQQMSVAKDWSIMEAFRKEHSIASRFMQHPDFVEGVSARLIRKPPETPKWQPSSIAEVSAQDVQSFFSNDQNPASLELLRERSQKTDYKNYPHFWTALPKEDAVKEFVESLKKRQTSVSKDVVKQHFHTVTNARPGLQAVLDDILARKTEQRGEQLLWLGEA
ncbi:MAG: hypothetical protein Q9162_006150 [Coniocarpon cinnabarinum]